MRFLLPAILLMACDTPDAHTDHDHSEPQIDVMELACDAAAEMPMALVAVASKDDANIPTLQIGSMAHRITLPDSGTAWVKIPNNIHRDVTYFFDRDDVALQITSEMQTHQFDALMPVDACEEVSSHQMHHMHDIDAFLELDGAGGELWILASDAVGTGDHGDHEDGGEHDEGNHDG